jgi:hypothetical protein
MPPRRHVTAAEANHAAELEGVKNILWCEDPEHGLYAVGRRYRPNDEELIGGPDESFNSAHTADTTNDKKRKEMYDGEHQKPEHEKKKKQKSEHEKKAESKSEKEEKSEPEKKQGEQTDAVE